MGSMQCTVEFGYQLSICSGTKENHGKPWSNWPAAGPSECNRLLASSPALNPRTLTLVPTLHYCIFILFFPLFFFFFSQVILSLQLFVCAYDLDKQQTLQHAYGRNKGICEQKCIQTDIYLYPMVVWKSEEVCCLSNNKDYVSQLIHFTGLHFSFFSLVLSSFHYKKENTSHFISFSSEIITHTHTRTHARTHTLSLSLPSLTQ
jgi:hypothetical protein